MSDLTTVQKHYRLAERSQNPTTQLRLYHQIESLLERVDEPNKFLDTCLHLVQIRMDIVRDPKREIRWIGWLPTEDWRDPRLDQPFTYRWDKWTFQAKFGPKSGVSFYIPEDIPDRERLCDTVLDLGRRYLHNPADLIGLRSFYRAFCLEVEYHFELTSFQENQ